MMAKMGDGQQLGQVKLLVDDLMEQLRCEASSNQECIQAFLSYINLHEKCKLKWDQNFKNANDIRLQQEDQIKVLTKERDGLQRALKLARRFFDEEKLLRKRAEDDRNSLEHQLQMISNLLQDNRNKLHDETREKLQYLSTMDQRLSTINESLYHDTTGSCLSDLSYSRSEDDLDIDSIRLSRRLRRSHGLVNDEAGINAKRRRSSSVLNTAKSEVVRAGPGECLVATTTVNIGDGRAPIASSVIETYPTTSTTSIVPPLKPVKPSAPQLSTDSGDSETEEFHRYPRSANKRKSNGSAVTAPFQSPTSGYFPWGGVSSSHLVSSRPHALINKTIIRPESCDPCGKKIKFGRIYCKCTECRTICHVECKDKLRLPCIPPGSGTPITAKDSFGKIADYAPPTAPMVPAIVVHCINEIEKRGFKETGLYRLSASDKEVKALKEKFLKGRIVPNLSQVNDIHVVTGFLKDFFRSLQEPLVMYSHRPQFVEAARISDIDTRRAALYQVCSELPKPNRDTLAFLILHLLRVVEANECEMPVLNLARVFGPTVVGYSQPTHELIDMQMYCETDEAIEVMKELLLIPAEFWRNFVVSNTTSMLCTPSTGSLRDHHGFFDTPSSGWYTVRKKK